MLKTRFEFSTFKWHYEYTREREDVVRMRENYLIRVAKYHADGFEIYFQDETWANKNMECNKVWQFENELLYNVPLVLARGAQLYI